MKTGGYSNTVDGSMKSTEIIYTNGTISEGRVSLPYRLEGHCILTLNDGRIMIIGGKNKNGMKEKVWFFNSPTNPASEPIELHSMHTARQRHACALFNNPMNGNKQFVLVAGGQDVNDAEILEIKPTDQMYFEKWTKCK